MARVHHFSWSWNLASTPEALWPLVSDTNRFNADIGLPRLQQETLTENGKSTRRASFKALGQSFAWDEQPFEWQRPSRFGFVRRYHRGPIQEVRTSVQLTAQDAGTVLQFTTEITATNAFWSALVRPLMRIIGKPRIRAAFARYDRLAAMPKAMEDMPKQPVTFIPGGRERLNAFRATLLEQRVNPGLLASLIDVIGTANDLAVARMRPYALADAWEQNRKDVLSLCLQAARVGLLEFRWEFLCPLCRGPQQSVSTLADAQNQLHCGSCNIDFAVDLDRSVELTFRPNQAIRQYSDQQFCVGGPQVTPHIVAQMRLGAGETKDLPLALEPGRYRLRGLFQQGGALFIANDTNAQTIESTVGAWQTGETEISTTGALRVHNPKAVDVLVMFERMAWTDQAATAAEVTALQMFRDLFSSEALRAGEHISVGQLTVVFTDLKGSTKMYQQIGDAPAFGVVLEHFDIIKSAIADYDGAIVKNIGDAIMAVFKRPANAIQAMLRAQKALAHPPKGQHALILRSGMHQGVCIAVNLNNRLDYFGTTVNKAARLEGKSSGTDVVISADVFADPEVQALIAPSGAYIATPFEDELKGFEGKVKLYRISLAA